VHESRSGEFGIVVPFVPNGNLQDFQRSDLWNETLSLEKVCIPNQCICGTDFL
jgi:hypothetical protein